MANDQIYNFISDYVDGIITREQFWIMAKFKYPTHQINFCTDEAIKCLKYLDCQGGNQMIGREDKKANDLFFTCSLIDYIARKTKNKRILIVQKLGKEKIEKIYNLADIYHSYNIEQVAGDFIEEVEISEGTFDNVKKCNYAIPTHWDIGKVYKRLIMGVAATKNIGVMEALFEVYDSFICDLIDDYNGSFYYENPQFILDTYLSGKVED